MERACKFAHRVECVWVALAQDAALNLEHGFVSGRSSGVVPAVLEDDGYVIQSAKCIRMARAIFTAVVRGGLGQVGFGLVVQPQSAVCPPDRLPRAGSR